MHSSTSKLNGEENRSLFISLPKSNYFFSISLFYSFVAGVTYLFDFISHLFLVFCVCFVSVVVVVVVSFPSRESEELI